MLPAWPPQSYTITIHVCCFSQELRASKLSSFSDMRNNTVLASSVSSLGGYAAIQTGKRQLLQEAVTDLNLMQQTATPAAPDHSGSCPAIRINHDAAVSRAPDEFNLAQVTCTACCGFKASACSLCLCAELVCTTVWCVAVMLFVLLHNHGIQTSYM